MATISLQHIQKIYPNAAVRERRKKRGEDPNKKKNNLNRAYYEFYFDEKPSKADNVLKKKFDSNIKMIGKLIEIGVESGEFTCEDPLTAAFNIVYLVEGMKTTALTLGISPDSYDRQILFILESLGVEA